MFLELAPERRVRWEMPPKRAAGFEPVSPDKWPQIILCAGIKNIIEDPQ